MEVTDEIKKIAGDLLERYKNEIRKSKHSASGDLVNTARYMCTFNGKWFEVIFQLEEYWKYLENGTRPHFPPTEPIEKWIRVKHIIPSSIGGKVPTTKQLAFLIARGISEHGTQPTKLLQKTIDSSDDLINALCDALVSQMEEELNEEVENTI